MAPHPHTPDPENLPGSALETPAAHSENVQVEASNPVTLQPLQVVSAAGEEPTSGPAQQTSHGDDASSTEGSSRLEVSHEHSWCVDHLCSSVVKVDSGWDTDSALGSDGQMYGTCRHFLRYCSQFYSSSTVSIRSSLYEYIEENGRRYHRYKAGSKYHEHVAGWG